MSLFSVILQRITNYFKPTSFNSDRNDYGERFYTGGYDDVQIDVKRESVEGIVTYLDGNRNGRIDGYVNFDSSSVITYKCDEKNISIGSEVLMDIVRNSKTSPWFASKLEVFTCPNKGILEDWEEETGLEMIKKANNEQIELPQKQVGMITYAFNDNLTFNNEIKFHQRDCGQHSFRPSKGDWVVVQYDHSANYYAVIGLSPLRYLDFDGIISSFDGNIGYVDKEIFFNKSITKGARLNRGVHVYGTAIESVQGRRCNFRALTIFCKLKSNPSKGLQMRLKSTTINGMENGVVNINKTSDKLGLRLSPKNVLEFGEQSINENKTKQVIITNENDYPIKLSRIELSAETNNQFVVLTVDCNGEKQTEITEKSSLKLLVKCIPQFPGFDNQKLFIEGLMESGEAWRLMLDVSVYVVDPVLSTISMGTDDINNKNKDDQRDKSDFLSLSNDFTGGVHHLSAAAPVKLRSVLTKVYPHKLKMYPIPEQLEHRVINKEDIIGLYGVLKEKLGPGNYSKKMDLLVHLEEINAKEEMKEFVLENVRLMRRRDTFGIEVPGLSEGRPSLMVGDKVNMKIKGDDSVTFSGSIDDILCEVIFVKFHANLDSNYRNEECTVSFLHSRLPFRRMHLGIELACGTLGDGILFPAAAADGKIGVKSSQCVRLSRAGLNELSGVNLMKEMELKLVQLKFYNESLNDLQRVAVVRILHGYSRPLPYVLFGPPGTGKTVTLVEAILQVYKNVASSRILVCAPSNSAADLLCLRLDESGVLETGEMVRMNAYRRSIMSELSDKEPIPARVLPYCKSIDDLSEIAMHRIIVCTCISSGSIYRLGLKSGHITHVFVDEAGQASEPEIMVSLGMVSLQKGQTIIAGDPMQLGPVIRSPHAQQLQESYLHRLLLTCDLYKKQKDICAGSRTHFNPLVVTQLLHNYRAHPALLKLPSDMFYDGTLISRVEKTRFINWKWLPNPEIPFIFHGVRGKELRNSRNPSTYNPSEAVMVVRWIGRLLQDLSGEYQLKDENISVITPYRAQVDCIRKLISSCLENVNLAKLKVASVEEFQGQENEVVIISTVRSSLDETGNNGVHESFAILNTVGSRLGFLSNKRRFNVSITRACSLLIVIGDPGLLKYDECWSSLIKYAKANNAFIGSESN